VGVGPRVEVGLGARGGLELGVGPKCRRGSEGLSAGVGRIYGVDSGRISGVF
jgi:hypothetical protein